MSTRRCPALGCEERIPTDRICCRDHWTEVPPDLRERVWHAYTFRRQDPERQAETVAEVVRYLRAEVEDV